MPSHRASPSAAAVACIGCVALASAMGIGRFAFTPLLPLMQQAGELTLREGAWLASANYAGYLAGALGLMLLPARPAAWTRAGLVAVAITTLAMAFAQGFAWWAVLRFIAGVASACVLVGVAAWALPALAVRSRASWVGLVFAGVGTGIAIAGVVAWWAGTRGLAPAHTWAVLGALAALACALAWRVRDEEAVPRDTGAVGTVPPRIDVALLVTCYGIFGFGYILPATFVPALAREALPDAAVFGWAWPLFGATAAASTIAASRWFGRMAPVRTWAASQLVMAVGVLALALSASAAAAFVSAACVGLTFMVVTMAAIRHARELAGAASPRVVAAMTAAFAFGQLAGPLMLPASTSGHEAIRWPGVVAACLLVVGALALLMRYTRPASVAITPGNPP